MSKKLEKTIHDAIAAHLPQQVAGQLKGVLEDYEKLNGKIEGLEETKERLEKEKKAFQKELEDRRSEYYIFQSDTDKLKERQKEQDERERELDRREMAIELEMTKRALGLEVHARDKVEEFMLNMSRSPVYKKTVLQDRSHAVEGRPGLVDNSGCIHQYPEPGHVATKTDETTEVVETE